MSEFETYRPRKIEFRGTHITDGWAVKVYSITIKENFESLATEQSVISQLDSLFLAGAKASELPVHRHAILIMHEAREGVWILCSWWTGGEMIETVVYFASYDTPKVISKSPHSGALVCTWELEVWLHERQAWINHVLKKAQAPDFNAYLNDVLK